MYYMQSNFEITLSSVEIYVLAGLLNYHTIIGVDDHVSLLYEQNIKKSVSKTVRNLEYKKMIHIQLDGTLYIDKNVKKIIDGLCSADTIEIVSENITINSVNVIYRLHKNDFCIQIKKLKNDNYHIDIINDNNCKFDFTELKTEKTFTIHEKLLLSDIEEVQKLIFSFQNESAENYLHKLLQCNSSIDLIIDILSKKASYIRTQIYRKRTHLYSNIFSDFTAFTNSCLIKIKADNSRILSFDSVKNTTVFLSKKASQ